MEREKAGQEPMNQENSQKDIKDNESSNTNRNPGMAALLKRLEERSPHMQTVDREIGVRFLTWFQDGVRVIRRAIENPALQDNRLIHEMEFFLYQIEHHFVRSEAAERIWDVFRYLRRFLKVSPSVRAKHVNRAIQMTERLEQAASKDLLKAGSEVRAWYGNRMWIVLRAIESPKFKETDRMMEIAFFLEALENYFIGKSASRHFQNAFRYLKCYFVIYPFVRTRQSERAIEMIGRIYQAMNYEFNYHAQIKPGPVNVETNKPRHRDRSIRELIGRMLVPITA